MELPPIQDVGRLARAFERLAPLAEAGPLLKPGRDSMAITLTDAANVLDVVSFAAGRARGGSAAVRELEAARAAVSQAQEAVAAAAIVPRRIDLPLHKPRFDVAAAAPHLRDAATHATAGARLVGALPEDELVRVGFRSVEGPATPTPEALLDNPWVTRDVSRTQAAVKRATKLLAPGAIRVHGTEHLPDGPFVIAATHGSNLDGIYYSAGTDRTVRAMANSKLLKVPVLGGLVAKLGAFPVSRGAAEEALGVSRGVLRSGDVVFVAPEGRFVYANHVGEAHGGAARIALAEGVPVVPASSAGTKPAWTRGEIGWPLRKKAPTIVFGETINLPRHARPEASLVGAVTEQIARGMDAAHERAIALRLERGTGPSWRGVAFLAGGIGVPATLGVRELIGND